MTRRDLLQVPAAEGLRFTQAYSGFTVRFDQRKQFSNDLFTERALKFVAGARQPFFLYLTYTIPHPNNKLFTLHGNGTETPDDKPYQDRPWPQVERNFASLVTRLDSGVGRLLAALCTAGQEQNTLVIFTSNNGPHQEGGHKPDFFQSSGPPRGIKRDLYDGGVRVPFLARWARVVIAARSSDQVHAFWDFRPTAAEPVGVAPPRGLDGISMLPALLGKPQPQQHDYLYWEFHENRFAQAIRTVNHKCFCRNPAEPIEVYDLAADPGERTDIAAKSPGLVRRPVKPTRP